MLGKTLKQGKIVFRISEKFYKGSLVTVEEAIDLIQHATIVNMVGERIVKRAIQENLVHPNAVVEIAGVPHAQILR